MARNRLMCLFITLACVAFVACAEKAPQDAADTGEEAVEEQPSEEPDDAGDTVPEAFSQEECLKMAEAMAGAAGGMGGGMGADPDADFDQAIAELRRAGDSAPEEIREDVGVFGDAMAEYLEILRDAGIDFSNPATFTTPKAQQAVKKATAVLEDPEVKQAQKNIDKGMKNVCGG